MERDGTHTTKTQWNYNIFLKKKKKLTFYFNLTLQSYHFIFLIFLQNFPQKGGGIWQEPEECGIGAEGESLRQVLPFNFPRGIGPPRGDRAPGGDIFAPRQLQGDDRRRGRRRRRRRDEMRTGRCGRVSRSCRIDKVDVRGRVVVTPVIERVRMVGGIVMIVVVVTSAAERRMARVWMRRVRRMSMRRVRRRMRCI